MSAEKVFAGIKTSEELLTGLGYNVQTCMTDFGKTAESVVQNDLAQQPLDCVNDRRRRPDRTKQFPFV